MHEILIGGTGGRGILTIGKLLAEAGMSRYRHVTYFPNYGSAMRGGDSEVTVILSDEEIGSQVVLNPANAIVMDASFLRPYEVRMRPGGKMIVDSSVVSDKVARPDVGALYIPAYRAALELGSGQVTNFVILGAYLEETQAVPVSQIEASLEKSMAGTRREGLLALNKKALRKGGELRRESRP